MDILVEAEVDQVQLDDEQPIAVGETAEEAALTTNVYSEIRRRLAERGIPAEQVAFIHDAKTPTDRAALFNAVNQGKIRILIGSTEKMGTGMNAQERLVAIHQITPPWRPGDLEQQVGRMIRQGNLYPEVFQFVHVTSGSFDGYVWQLLENKAGFIGQIASGEVTAREVDDVSENVLTFSEIKALASGNPKIMEKVVADTELARLEAVRHSWRTSQLSARINLSSLIEQRTRRERDIASFQAAIKVREAHTSEKFVISLLRAADSEEMTLISDRETAGKRIRALAAGASFMITPGSGECVEIGRYRGFGVIVTMGRTSTGPAPMVFVQVSLHQLAVNIGESDAGVTMSLDAKIRSFDTELAKAQDELKVIAQKVASLETETSRPWDHEERYLALKIKVAELEKELNVEKKPESPAEGVEGEISIECSTPAPAAPAHQRDVPDTSAEVNAAIEAIRLLHADQHLLARFGIGKPEPDSIEIEQPVAITPETVKALEQKVEQAQLQLEFAKAILDAIPSGETVQLDLFGGFAATTLAAAPKKRRR